MKLQLAPISCALAFAFACATAEPAVAPTPSILAASPAAAPPPSAGVSFDAKSFAAGMDTPVDCEGGARHLRKTNPRAGWEALRACVDKPRFLRGPFTQLQLLTTGAWDEDLQSQPDAPRLMTKLIALRGGDVEGDLPTVQKSRVPLFALAAAFKQPDLYKGRYLVVRGELGELKMEGGQVAVMLSESSLRGATREMQVGTKSVSEHQNSGSAHVEVQTTNHGDAKATAGYNDSGRSTRHTVQNRFENEKHMTGRTAVGRLAKADPFLEPSRDFIFLARFDGLRPSAEEGDPPTALLTVVSYFPPSPLLIE